MLKTALPQPLRWLLAGFTLVLAGVLAIWSYQSSAQSAASLSATPAQARQNDTVTLSGKGFSPSETVAIWITYPDFSVFGVTEVQADGDGSIDYAYLPDFLGASFTPTGRYTYTARGTSSGREVYATISVSIGRGAAASAGVTMRSTPNGPARFTIQGSNFSGGETLALWLRLPDNSVQDLGQVTAGPAGSFEYNLNLAGAPVGRYAFTARGLRSSLTGITELTLTQTDLSTVSGRAGLTVDMRREDQRSTVTFTGSGFAETEIVSIWVTLPNGATAPIGDVVVSNTGGFVATFYLSEQLPAGRHVFSAYGNFSQRRGTAEFTLVPGGAPGQVQEPNPGNPFDIVSPEQPEKPLPEEFNPPEASPTPDPNVPAPTPDPGLPTPEPTPDPGVPTPEPTPDPGVPTPEPTAMPADF